MTAVLSPPKGRSRRRLSKAGQRPQEASFLTPFESVSLGLTGFFFRDGFLGAPLSRQVRAEALRFVNGGALRPAGIGAEGKRVESVRSDHLCWMEKTQAGPGIRALMQEFDGLRKAINREFYLGLDRYEMQLAHYPAGSQGYKKHLDAFRGRNERNR
ncbi:MAG: hypothetical protein KC800_32620, partial [Candidatus Eremiobacteraeota bacterium]|nr:hypothetical protein [Candidatus Eremiobacteraeota bacterium]